LIAEIIDDIDQILLRNDSSPIILVAGDFNGLKTDFIEELCGLTLIVHDITHGKKILDKVFINCPDLFVASVYKSLLKTKHSAVLINSGAQSSSTVITRPTKRKQVKVYDVRSHAIDRLRAAICESDWSEVYSTDDITAMYEAFLLKCRTLIDSCIPVKMVSLGPRDPEFVTPLIKSLLKTRNKLRRGRKFEQADTLATKINRLIAQERSRTLEKLNSCNSKKLWNAVRKVTVSNGGSEHHPLLNDLDAVNNFFSSISFDCNYKEVQQSDLHIDQTESVSVGAYEIERYLKGIKPTSAGPDCLPRWLLHDCSVELCDVVSHIVSRSVNSGVVPQQWKTAYVTPVQKANNPKTLSDFRPISVTSILSRLTEKIVVRKWLMPAVPSCNIDDQFGFRPTGSTTCALVYLTHNVTEMLETNSYVRCLCVDFSKAFDVVDHSILYQKLACLSLPPAILQWLLSFLTNRTQSVKSGGRMSASRPINRGTIQGSGIGPANYIVMASDLRALSRFINKLFKYADDTTLLVPEHTDVQLEDEFQALKQWAENNKMILNMLKTKELVFHRPNPCLYVPPPLLTDIERVNAIKLLGLLISDTFCFDEHLKNILTVCAQRCYLLKTLRWQGLSRELINTIYQALIISRLQYALPSWGGFLSKKQITKVNNFLSRSHRLGYTLNNRTFYNILNEVDSVLFTRVLNPTHCLNNLLPPARLTPMTMRNTHCFQLPLCHYMLFKNSFIPRTVFKYSY